MRLFIKTRNMARIEALWDKSRNAEEKGNLTRAIEIQKQIISLGGPTYAAIFRLASLYYRNKNYEGALDFYEQAWSISDSRDWPLEGMRNCYQAMGDSTTFNQIDQRLHEQRLATVE